MLSIAINPNECENEVQSCEDFKAANKSRFNFMANRYSLMAEKEGSTMELEGEDGREEREETHQPTGKISIKRSRQCTY